MNLLMSDCRLDTEIVLGDAYVTLVPFSVSGHFTRGVVV